MVTLKELSTTSPRSLVKKKKKKSGVSLHQSHVLLSSVSHTALGQKKIMGCSKKKKKRIFLSVNKPVNINPVDIYKIPALV